MQPAFVYFFLSAQPYAINFSWDSCTLWPPNSFKRSGFQLMHHLLQGWTLLWCFKTLWKAVFQCQCRDLWLLEITGKKLSYFWKTLRLWRAKACLIGIKASDQFYWTQLNILGSSNFWLNKIREKIFALPMSLKISSLAIKTLRRSSESVPWLFLHSSQSRKPDNGFSRLVNGSFSAGQ